MQSQRLVPLSADYSHREESEKYCISVQYDQYFCFSQMTMTFRERYLADKSKIAVQYVERVYQ